MGLCETDTIREIATAEFNKRTQSGEKCNFDEIHNKLRIENGYPPLETEKQDIEEIIDPINDKQHYFWVKLHHDFFDTLIIKKLRRKEKGDTLALLYQRVILLSLKHNG